jgi:hypothetical protein
MELIAQLSIPYDFAKECLGGSRYNAISGKWCCESHKLVDTIEEDEDSF